MAGKDKTTAWENVKWIKAHLPSWEKKGMTKGFLNSLISPRYKGCEADVGSAITCDPTIFETLYNQPDFLDKLKEICKKYCMPYGKVPKEVEEKAEMEADLIYPDFIRERPLRVEKGKKHQFKNLPERLASVGYTIDYKIENLDEITQIVTDYCNKSKKADGRRNGNANMCWNNDRVQFFIDSMEKGLYLDDIADILGVARETAIRYRDALRHCGVIQANKHNKKEYYVDEDIVHYVGGRKKPRVKKFEADLFS